jgi:SAM-dependent methyltransferase
MTNSSWLKGLALRLRKASSFSPKCSSREAASRSKRKTYTVRCVTDAVIDKDGIVKITTEPETMVYRPKLGHSTFSVGRLIFSDSMRLGHAEQMRKVTKRQLSQFESPELKKMITPIMKEWTANKADLDVLELGPAYTTAIPEALYPVLRSYRAVDFSLPYLQKQREILNENPSLAARCQMIVSDIYDLKLATGSCDLIFTSCHPPLVSSSADDKCEVLDKIYALLRTGGTFALFPWYFNEQPQAVNEHLLRLFCVRQVAHQNDWRERLLIILEKR